MAVRIRRDDLPQVIGDLPGAIDKAVQDMASDLQSDLESAVWRDTGMISRQTETYETRFLHAKVAIGWYLGKGFYSGFQEFGSSRQAARPIVAPAAHAAEPVFVSKMETEIRRACQA